MTQNDGFGYVNLWAAYVKIIMWLLPYKKNNRGSTIASCYLNPIQADVLFLYPLKTSQ